MKKKINMEYNTTMDRELDNVPLQECDWKIISKLNLSIKDIEYFFGKIPKKYKKFFKK